MNPLSYDSGDRNKHLEFIQAAIARLGSNSFLIKGWAITVAAAFYGFSAQRYSWRVALVSLLPTAAFWFLDGYFLRQERLYRQLYDRVRRGDEEVEHFSMDASRYRTAVPWWRTSRSITLSGFYGTIAVIGAILLIAVSRH